MAVDKINVTGDTRVERRTAQVNGKTYGYLLGQPKAGQYRATVFLIHGFPDLSMGWRYQIPFLINMGLRVVAPDCLGYGRTDAPDPPQPYSHKQCADDIKALALSLGASKIILGGHDWGATLVYRIALWHPDLVTHVFTVCVPFVPPSPQYLSLEELVRTRAPNFTYQLQFKSEELEKAIRSKDEIRQFLLALYGGRTGDGELGFDARKGVLLDRMMRLGPSRLLGREELDYYTEEFARNGIHGPLNWYRTREINYRDELAILDRRITVPVLFIQALRDSALPPHLGKGMSKVIPKLTVKQVDTSHWALWEKPDEVNKILVRWLEEVVFVNGQSGSKL
ncbi:hypothetical protein VTN00DRAFT_4036 [Thermoascus crustaceus]|uniref:uncharacterized protein n=1 Tax=Thermoascus crustaceus TaxID=5088 RepID=UPI003742D9E5